MTSLASFWAGPRLSALEKACLRSFTARGYRVTLYSYHDIADLPEGIERQDATLIAPSSDLTRFIHRGAPNTAHFADYFRYLVFLRTGSMWIDADIVLLQRFDPIFGENFMVQEGERGLNNAIMRIDQRHPKLVDVIAAAEELRDRELRWAQTGPDLLLKVFGRSDRAFAVVHPESTFFPVHHDVFWKLFLPEHRDECEELCQDAFGVHLFNNLIDKAAIWKDIAPPPGSYLAERFAIDGSDRYFKSAYPEANMRQLIKNWRSVRDGSEITFKTALRRVVPSGMQSLRNRMARGHHL